MTAQSQKPCRTVDRSHVTAEPFISTFEPLLTPGDAARYLKVHPKTVTRLAREDSLPSLRIGKHYRFRQSDLTAWVESGVNSGRQSPSAGAIHDGNSLEIPRRIPQSCSGSKKPDIWVYRWRQLLPDGSRVQRKKNIRSVLQFSTESSAKRAVENLRTEINEVETQVGELRLRDLWGHFQAHELRDPDVDRSPTTIKMYLSNFKLHIVPRWGEMYLSEIKAVEVERWLRAMSLAPSTKAKLKHHLSSVFSHAIRHELYDKLNPIASVRQGSKRVSIPDILTLAEMCRIVAGIDLMIVRTAVLVAAVTGLRRSEIRGLKWSDVDVEKLWLSLHRGRVRNLQTKLKTEASRRGRAHLRRAGRKPRGVAEA
jgi:excisionase family DNA binding protein